MFPLTHPKSRCPITVVVLSNRAFSHRYCHLRPHLLRAKSFSAYIKSLRRCIRVGFCEAVLTGLVGCLALCARMSLVVHLGEMLKIQMGVNLGGGNIGVAQQFLHQPQIAAGFQHVAGKGVAQHMGVHMSIHALAQTELVHALLYGAMAEALAALADKQRLFLFARRRPAYFQPAFECVYGLFAHG